MPSAEPLELRARRPGPPALRLLTGLGRAPVAFSTDSQIAHALCDAQLGHEAARAAAPKSLEEIAALAQRSGGWSQAFKQMKMEGLLAEQTLGQVVARWNNRHARPAAIAELAAAPPSAPWPAPSRTGP